MSESPATSKQVSNLDEIIALAVGRFCNEAKPDHDGYQRLFKRRGEAEDGLVALLTRLSAEQPDYTLARSILGGDFVTSEELATKRPDLACNPDQIAELADSIPSADVLHWIS